MKRRINIERECMKRRTSKHPYTQEKHKRSLHPIIRIHPPTLTHPPTYKLIRTHARAHTHTHTHIHTHMGAWEGGGKKFREKQEE
jgi:hypothetical protein